MIRSHLMSKTAATFRILRNLILRIAIKYTWVNCLAWDVERIRRNLPHEFLKRMKSSRIGNPRHRHLYKSKTRRTVESQSAHPTRNRSIGHRVNTHGNLTPNPPLRNQNDHKVFDLLTKSLLNERISQKLQTKSRNQKRTTRTITQRISMMKLTSTLWMLTMMTTMKILITQLCWQIVSKSLSF